MTDPASGDWRREYPWPGQSMGIDGHRLNYVDEGAGLPLVMVHGNPTWSFYWRRLIHEFAPRYRAVAIDHLGCGLSDKPQRYHYSLARHIDNLVTVADRLDLRRATLLAHDWGGAIGLGAVLARPERFARIVLFNTGAFPPPFVPLRIRVCRTPLLGQVAVRGLNLFARAAQTMALHDPRKLSPAAAAGLLAPYDSWSNRIGIWRFVRDIPFTPRHPTWRTLAEIDSQLPSLGQRPIALIWGMRDWCFRPECLDRFRTHWPAAAVHRLADAGHYVVEEAHDSVGQILREFLSRSDTTL